MATEEEGKARVMAIQARMVTDQLREFLMRWHEDGAPPEMMVQGQPMQPATWFRARLYAARTIRRQAAALGVRQELLERLDNVIAQAERERPDLETAMRLRAGPR
jgi:hypothetical protein